MSVPAGVVITGLPVSAPLSGSESLPISQNGTAVQTTAAMIAALAPILQYNGTYAALPAASIYPFTIAITSDLGVAYSNGVTWTVTGAPFLALLYTYATLPAPSPANVNMLARTSDKGPVYSNGVAWIILYSATNATLSISTSAPLPAGTNGVAYSDSLTATQGTPPYTWALLQAQSGVGNVWSIPTGTNTLQCASPVTTTVPDALSVQVTDSTGAPFQKLLTVSINASAGTQAAAPTATPSPGTYSNTQSVALASTTPSPTIYYTTNGSIPTTASTVYAGPITVGTTQTIKAIAIASGYTQSTVASFAYTITSAGSQYKFNPGDYMMPPQYGLLDGASVNNDLTWIKTFQTYPCKGYICQRQLSDLDQGPAIDNNIAHAVSGTGNFAGFTSQIGAIFNLHQTYNPGAHFGIYINTIEQWGSTFPTGTFTSPVPNYLMNCGGSISIPNSFGSGSSTNYTLYKYSNNTCGVAFYAYNSPASGDYGFLEAAWWDPAIRAAIRNTMQALALYQLPTATAYNSGTTYTQGDLATSGGSVYCSIYNGNNVGNAVTNTTYWELSSNAYAGQTLDQCPLVEFIGNNDETSAVFNNGPATPGSTTSANVCSYQNYYTGYLGHLADKQAAFPHTMVGGCFSFVITGTTGEQDASTWTGYLATVNAVTGISFSQADIKTNTFTPGSAHPTNAMVADIGLNPDASYGGTLPPFGSYSGGFNYVGVMPQIIQRQPEDYAGGSATPTNVNQLIAMGAYLKETHRLWSPQDDTFSYSTWGTTIQPTFTAGTAVTTTRPSNLP